MNPRFWTALVLSAAATPALAGGRVGNGGDSMRLIFARAKEHAATIVLKVKEASLDPHTRQDVKDFIVKNRDALAADIVATSHEWSEEAEPTCALTQVPTIGDPTPNAAKIHFSYPTCAKSVENFGGVTEVLIHESVHHFGYAEEEFADAVAIAVAKAWQNGSLEWKTMTSSGAPAARESHAAAWAGSYMIVHGGTLGSSVINSNTRTNSDPGVGITNSFYKYDPRTNAWTELSRVGSPSRSSHTALWFEGAKKLVVWGGFSGTGDNYMWQHSGAVWDEATNKWSSLPAVPYAQPAAHNNTEFRLQTAIASDDKLIVWGGRSAGNSDKPLGAVYDVANGRWLAATVGGGPVVVQMASDGPVLQGGHSAVWADGKMLVWGGLDYSSNRLASGAVYDLAYNRWTAMTAAPDKLTGRYGHAAVWTGQVMIVFSGAEAQTLKGTGGVYDPERNTWTPTVTEIAVERRRHSAIWTGQDMLVWGGKSSRFMTYFSDVVHFNPTNVGWRAVSAKTTPSARQSHTAVWTGSAMIVWGGLSESGTALNDGGVYYP